MFNEKQLQQIVQELNHQSVLLKNTDATFVVHYWGGQLFHKTNMMHRHSFFEVCYVMDGTGQYIEEGQSYPLQKGTIFLSRPHKRHQIVNDDHFYLIWIAFELVEAESSEKTVNRLRQMRQTPLFYQTGVEMNAAILMWQSLYAHVLQYPDSWTDVHSRLAYTLLLALCELLLPHKVKGRRHLPDKHASQLLYQTRLYIRDNLSSPLKLRDVADYVHVSERHLSRLFQNNYQMPFSRYVRTKRLEKAEQLMTKTDFALDAIALKCGFSNVHYFSKVFKAEKNMPPGEWRRNAQRHL